MNKKIVIVVLAGLLGIFVFVFALFNALTNSETLGKTNPINTESTKQIEHGNHEMDSGEQKNDSLLKETQTEIKTKPTIKKEVEENKISDISENHDHSSVQSEHIDEVTVNDEDMCGLHEDVEENVEQEKQTTNEDILTVLQDYSIVDDVLIDVTDNNDILNIYLSVEVEDISVLEQMVVDVVDYYCTDYEVSYDDVFGEEFGRCRFFAPADIYIYNRYGEELLSNRLSQR